MKFLPALFLALFTAAAQASPLIEYHMHMPPAAGGQKRVALTFDACTGKVDDRVVDTSLT